MPAPLRVALNRSTDRDYAIHFQSLDTLPDLLAETGLRTGRCVVITDTNVGTLYGTRLVDSLARAGWTPEILTLPPGEATKSTAHLQQIYDILLPLGLDRQTPILALGGGVVGDLAGFAAASLLRGLPLVQIPTTLVAQVDSAIGGKTGINHAAGKNLIGAFHQPLFVCIDVDVLLTLPEREWHSGLAEVVKHALIADADFFEFLESRWNEVLNRHRELLPELIRRAAAVKVEIVSEDEKEHGRRALLNFGHTFGHAIERVTGYGTFTHGEAIALGMKAALDLSHRLRPDFEPTRALALVERIPVQARFEDVSVDALIEAMQSDKKRTAEGLRVILLNCLGEAYVTAEATRSEIRSAWAVLDPSGH